MGKFLEPSDIFNIRNDVYSLRQDLQDFTNFYLVFETVSASSGNPMELLFGEPVDPFNTSGLATVREFLEFPAYIKRKYSDPDYSVGGFNSAARLKIETFYQYGWTEGLLIMSGGVDYRITDINVRGLYPDNRYVMMLEKVT